MLILRVTAHCRGLQASTGVLSEVRIPTIVRSAVERGYYIEITNAYAEVGGPQPLARVWLLLLLPILLLLPLLPLLLQQQLLLLYLVVAV